MTKDRPTFWIVYFDERLRCTCVVQTMLMSGEVVQEFHLEDVIQANQLCAILNKLEFGLQLTKEQLGED